MIHLSQGEKAELWSSLTKLCRCHEDFSYYYLKRKKFPFEYKGWNFKRIKPNVCEGKVYE